MDLRVETQTAVTTVSGQPWKVIVTSALHVNINLSVV